MNFGRFDRLLTLLAPAVALLNEYGEPTAAAFVDRGDVWAQVKYDQGSEVYLADEKTAVQRITFTLRYRADITPLWRVQYQGRIYLLDAVAEIGRRQGLTLSSFSRGQESAI
jgi:SPP1 family predicted phage head-tail adaptor